MSISNRLQRLERRVQHVPRELLEPDFRPVTSTFEVDDLVVLRGVFARIHEGMAPTEAVANDQEQELLQQWNARCRAHFGPTLR